VGRNHPDTSHKAAQKALPNSGTKKKIIYDLIVASGMFGVCDHEIEESLGWTHQTASSSRNALMNDGWVIDSGHRRATKQGNDAIAWIAVL
jgi:predicted transcriptional regulator